MSYDIKGGALLRVFGSDVERYEDQLRFLNEEKESYKERGVEWRAERSWSLKSYNDAKMEIINRFKCVHLEEV